MNEQTRIINDSIPMLSIIIPTYNSENVIEYCLDSILGQTFQNYEILIIDGGSTDKTPTIIKNKLSQHPACLFISEPDNGIYDAMNKGLRLAQGEWLFFLGSDDTFFSNETLEQVQNHLSQEADFLYGNALNKKLNKIFDGEFDTGKLFQKTIYHQAIFYRKALCKLVGEYNLDYKIYADWEYNFRCFSLAKKIKFIDQIICNYAGTGISSITTDKLFIDNKYEIIKKIFGANITNRIFRSCRYDFYRYYLNARAAKNWRKALIYWCIFAYHSANEKFTKFHKND